MREARKEAEQRCGFSWRPAPVSSHMKFQNTSEITVLSHLKTAELDFYITSQAVGTITSQSFPTEVEAAGYGKFFREGHSHDEALTNTHNR